MKWTDALPVIGTFLGGPAGGLAGAGIQWLAEKLGASEKTVEGIKQTLSGMTSDQLVTLKKLDIEFQMFCLDNDIKLDLAQIAVNAEEARSKNLFVAGWRPAVGWICVFSMAYAAIIEPIARFVTQVAFSYKGTFPVIDTMLTMQILLGLLGLGAMRSYDKKQGATK